MIRAAQATSASSGCHVLCFLLRSVNVAPCYRQRLHPAKVRLAAALKQSISGANAWLAERRAMGKPASASQFVRRYLLREESRAETAGLVSRVKRGSCAGRVLPER
jgi:hypothetical protein